MPLQYIDYTSSYILREDTFPYTLLISSEVCIYNYCDVSCGSL
jgi:hypothetical protein